MTLPDDDAPQAEIPAPRRIDAPTLVGLAADLGERILNQARVLDDGSLTWDRGFDLETQPVTDSGLFNGRVGEALLFAALARATGNRRFEEGVCKILAPTRALLQAPGAVDAMIRRIGLGTSGVGSIAYALSQIAWMLDEPSIARDARNVVRQATSEAIVASAHVDVTWGFAGWILGVLSTRSTDPDAAIESARTAARAALGRRVVDAHTQLRALPTVPYSAPATGFAHGNSGIACALLRLSCACGGVEYYDAAVELFTFERTLYREDARDWMETHADARQTMCSWCHGAPGIALARSEAVALVRASDEPAIMRDLQRALRRTAAARYVHIDSLCCGALGRADCLLEAAVALGNDSLTLAAHAIVAQVVARARESGYQLAPSSELHTAGGMWQGLTGIAYELLRLADPAVTPSVLSLRTVSANVAPA